MRQTVQDNDTYERHASEDRVITTATTTAATFTVGTSNQYAGALATFKPATSTTAGAATTTATTTLTYDNNGNVLTNGPWTYAWDYLNRMTSAGNGTATSTYAYDQNNNRVKAIESGITTVFPNTLYTTTIGSTSTTTKYIFGNGLDPATVEKVTTAASVSTSTPTYVQSSIGNTGSTTLSSAVTTGNIIVVGLTAWSASTLPSNAVTDNKGNTYTKVTEAANGNDQAAIYYAKNVTGGSSFTVSSSIGGSISAQEYSGVSTSSPLDVSAHQTGSGTTVTSGNATSTLAHELYFGLGWSIITNDGWTAGTGYTLRQTVQDNDTYERHASEDRVITTATTTAATFTVGTSNQYAGALATFKPAATTQSGGATTTVRYMATDHLGSTNVVTDATGAVVETLDYYPYGASKLDTKVGTYSGDFRKYIGQFSDPTGLSYLNARYYNGSQGQFLSEDPVFLADAKQQNLKDSQSLNSYSYANDDPIVKSYPDGKQVAGALALGPVFGIEALSGPVGWAALSLTTLISGAYILSNLGEPNYQTTVSVSGQGYNTEPRMPLNRPPGKWGGLILTAVGTGFVFYGGVEILSPYKDQADFGTSWRIAQQYGT